MGEEKKEERIVKMLIEVTCPKCGTKYMTYLKACPKCGTRKKS